MTKFNRVKQYIEKEIKLLDNKLKYFKNERNKANRKKNDAIYWTAEIDHQIRILQWAIKILQKKVKNDKEKKIKI